MAITLAELLDTFENQLVLHTAKDDELDRNISWVAPTELLDPTPFLSSNELVLTTGAALVDEDSAAYDSFVERLSNANTSSLGFGTGLNHSTMPAKLISAANKYDLPVFEVPYEMPFIEISRTIAESVIADQFKLLHDSLAVHERLASVLLGGGDLTAMIERLHQLTGGPAAVIDIHGRLLASSPGTVDWPTEAIKQTDGPHGDPSREVHTAPIRFDGELVAYLFVRIVDEVFSIHAIPYATTLISLELSRRHAELNGRRELVGQVIEDLLAQRLPDEAAARRLTAFGVDLAQPVNVIVAATNVDSSIRRMPWGQKELGANSSRIVSAYIEDELISIAAPDAEIDQVTQIIYERLRMVDPNVRVGIGGAHSGVSGLRLSYFEAREATFNAEPGIHLCEPINLSTLLLVNRELPVRDMAQSLLGPLIEHDTERGSDLMQTLTVFLETSGSVAKSARLLTLHRNSMRYRLRLIEELTGRNVLLFPEQVKLWIALQALKLEGRIPEEN